MGNHFLTIENLANLGVLDEFRDLYDTARELYELEWRKCENLRTNPFGIQEKVKANVKPKLRELLDSFLRKYLYLFTDAYPLLHPDAPMLHGFYITYLIDKRNASPSDRITISFRTFLAKVLEPIICNRVWTRIIKERPRTPYEIVEAQMIAHFNNLAEAARMEICIPFDCDNLQPTDLIVFKSLSAISCNLKGHFVENCTIEVARLNSDNAILLPIHHCKNCGRLFIGNETLKQYEKVWGKLCINTRDDRCAANNSDFYTSESPLHKLGYNVIAGEFSEKERQALLVKIYERKWLTLFEIQRDIEKAIRIFEYRSRYQAAVKKWQTDLYFITEYVKNRQL